MNPPDGTASERDLGPSVTAEFSDAVGIAGLRAEARGPGRRAVEEAMAPPPAAQPPAPSPPRLPPAMLQTSLAQIDATVSKYIGVDPEDEQIISGLAQSVQPLVDYYTSKGNPVVAMWTVAIVGVGGYALMKYKKVADKPEEPEHGS